ncbi:MAG: hypothetical protein M3R24_29110 [Chloroflexota bacterium]|nr:hypothetical protein [Chloroflexota bacterium]
MEMKDVQYGQRIRVNVPGAGDHGQCGTVKKVRGGACSVHLDWDCRPQHVVVFYPADLDLLPNEPVPSAMLDAHAVAQ